ncbi:MAG: GNAT family N-acetyltransferase [Myxococcota bacterium]
MGLHPAVHSHLIQFLESALEQSLEQYRARFPHITVELGSFEQHEVFIPAIAELLRREDARGTKGMSGRNQSVQDMGGQVAWELQTRKAVLVREHDELFGYATLGTWETSEGRVLEFCSAVVDEQFRGLGFGRILVDAREILSVAEYLPQGYQPMAFCNQSSARIYNLDLWKQASWEWYRRFPPPVVCKAECQWNRQACDCVVLAMDVGRLGELAGLPRGSFEVP